MKKIHNFALLIVLSAVSLLAMAMPATVNAFTVYFDNATAGWTTPHIHYWGASESTWPGDAMTKVEGNIWKYDVPDGTTGLLFNAGDGDATKTSDFAAVADHVYNQSGDQGVYNGGGGGDTPVVNPGNAFNVYFDNSVAGWATPYIHYWGASESTWPGVAMTKTEGNVWQYTVPAGTTGLLFNAGDGDATKTSDFAAIANHIYNQSGDQGVYNGTPIPDPNPNPDPTPASGLYIIGEPAGGWSANVGTALSGSNGVYTYTGTFSGEWTYFGFATKLGATATDWATLNANRYGSLLNDELPEPDAEGNTIADYFTLSAGSSFQMDYPNGTSFRLAEGTYTLTIDTNAMTITVASGSNPNPNPDPNPNPNPNPDPTPDGGLYIIGEPAGGWSANVGTALSGSNGVYTYTGVFTSEWTYFGFATKLGATATDWETLNANRYGSLLNDELPVPDAEGNTIADYFTVSAGTPCQMDYPNATSFRLAPGNYKLTIDTNAMTLKVENTSGIEAIEAEEAPAVYFNLQGMPVENPSNGIYIRVQGKNASKVYIR